MTKSIESVGTTITITTTSSISPVKSDTEACIGFLPSYLPNKDPPPYPLDVPPGMFPSGYSPNIPSNSSCPPYPLDVTIVDKAPPPYPSKNAINNQVSRYGSLVHCEKEEIMVALSQLKCKSLWKSEEEKNKEFVKAQNKVTDIINDPKSCLSAEEKESFQKDVQEINEARNKYLKEQKGKNDVEENATDDNETENRTKCSFDITTLLLKIPQLLVNIIICIKVGMSGITTPFGGMFFTLSLTAGLFTTYYLILYFICRVTKRSRITEFLHSFVCTLSFFFVSFYSTDPDLMIFGFLAMVPYGCEVCWTSWNFIKEEKSRLFPHL